jgi:hypothetical protein
MTIATHTFPTIPSSLSIGFSGWAARNKSYLKQISTVTTIT